MLNDPTLEQELDQEEAIAEAQSAPEIAPVFPARPQVPPMEAPVDSRKPVGQFIEDDILQDMYTFPSVDKGKMLSPEPGRVFGEMFPAEATVYKGNITTDFLRLTSRNMFYSLGNFISNSLQSFGLATDAEPFGVLGSAFMSTPDLVKGAKDIAFSGALSPMAGGRKAVDIGTQNESFTIPDKGTFGTVVRNFGIHMSEELQRMYAEDVLLNPVKPNPAVAMAADVTSSILLIAGYMTVGRYLGGSQAAGMATTLGVNFFQDATDTLVKSYEKGNTFKRSAAYGISVGAVTTSFEKIGLDKIFAKSYSALKNATQRVILNALTAEGLTEAGQQAITTGANIALGGKRPDGSEYSALDYASEVLYAAGVGAFAGGLMSASVTIPQRYNAIQALKEMGFSGEKAKTIADDVIATHMNSHLEDAAEEYNFTPQKNSLIQQQIDGAQEAHTRGTGFLATINAYTKSRPFSREAAFKELSEYDQFDPGRVFLAMARAEAKVAADEKAMQKSVPEFGTGKIRENMVKASVTPGLSEEQVTERIMPVVQVAEPVINPDTSEAMQKAIKGRITFLNAELDSLAKDINRMGRELEDKGVDPDVESMDENVSKLQRDYQTAVNKSIEAYAEAETLRLTSEQKALKGNDIQLKTRDLIQVTAMLAKQTVSAANQNFLRGKRAVRSELNFMRSILHKLVSMPGLRKETRDALKFKYSNFKSAEDFTNALPSIETAIDTALNDTFIEGITNGIERLADTFTPRGSGTHKKVKFDATSQKLADVFLKVYKDPTANPVDEREKLDGSAESVMRMIAAQAATRKHPVSGQDLSAEELLSVFDTLRDFAINGARAKIRNAEINKQAQIKLNAAVVKDITGGKANVSDLEFGDAGKLDRMLAKLPPYVGVYDVQLALLARHAEEAFGESVTETALSAHNALRKAEILDTYFMGRAREAVYKAYPGITNSDQIAVKFYNESSLTDPSAITLMWDSENKNDGAMPLTQRLSRQEAITAYTWSQNHLGEKKLRKAHGWTDETFAQLNEVLTAQDKAYARALIEIGREIHPEINKVHEKLMGFSLPMREMYFPFWTEKLSEAEDSMFGSLFGMDAKNPDIALHRGFLQPALSETTPLKFAPAHTIMQKYISDASHYIGTAEVVTRMKNTFGSPEVQKAVKAKYGKKTVAALDAYVDVLERNSLKSGHYALQKGFGKAVTNLAQGLIALKWIQVPKQMSSMFSALELMGPKDYFKHLSSFPDAVKSGEVYKLLDTAYFRERGSARKLNIDTRLIMEMRESQARKSTADMLGNDKLSEISQKIERFAQNPKFADYMFLPTQIGDFGGALVAGWTAYQHYMSEGKAEPEARILALRHVNSTQQSKDLTELSPFMLDSSPATRLLTTFQQAPVQFMSRALHVMMTAGTNKWDWMRFSRMYSTFFIVLPMVFDYISRGFREDDDPLYAPAKAVTGPFDQAFLVGPFYKWVVMQALAGGAGLMTGETYKVKPLNQMWDDSLGLWNSVRKNAGDAERALKKVLEDEPDMADVFKLGTELSEALLPLTGAPGGAVRAGFNALEGLNFASEEGWTNNLRRYLMIAGMSRAATAER